MLYLNPIIMYTLLLNYRFVVDTLLFLSSFSVPVHGQKRDIKHIPNTYTSSSDSTEYVDVLNRVGFLSYMSSADSCLYYGIRAKQMADRLSYTKGKADALVNIGTAMYLKGLPSQSLALFTKALVQYQLCSYETGVALMLMNSAVVYKDFGDSLNAVKFSKMALSQSAGFAEDSAISMLYAKYALIRPGLLTDSSSYYLNKGEQIATRYKDNRVILFIKHIRAEKLLRADKLKEALPLILELLSVARENKMHYYEIIGLDCYARYFIQSKNIDKAILCYEQGFRLASNQGFSTLRTRVLKSLSDAYTIKTDRTNIDRINKILVAGLEQETNNNRNFAGNYLDFSNTQQQMEAFELREKTDHKMIILLVGFSLAALATIIYILFLNQKLITGSKKIHIANEKITVQNALLNESDHFKASLISMLAHDFRSPLATTLGMLSVLKENEFEKGELDQFYISLQDEVQNTLLTFDNILQWVKKQYAGYVYQEEKLMIYDLMQQAASMHGPSIAAKEISLINQIPDSAVIRTDKEIIQFINRNLIHNAVKFSPQKGNIVITSTSQDNEIIVSVKDEGCGMTSEQIEKLFTIGISAINGTASQKGAGVALTICKEFIDRLNGRIWSESIQEQGTTLFYALPLRKAS